MNDLIRRLRKWAYRFPHEEATVNLVLEAAIELDASRNRIQALLSIIESMNEGRDLNNQNWAFMEECEKRANS